jgi:chemotaxis protein histidine kinase CheA
MSDDDDFELQLGLLREKFRARLSVYRDRLAEARSLYTQGQGEEAVRRLRAVAHELAGAGGTFGYGELSDLATELEAAADLALRGNAPLDGVVAPLRQLMREIDLSL